MQNIELFLDSFINEKIVDNCYSEQQSLERSKLHITIILIFYHSEIQICYYFNNNNRAELPARPLFPLVEERATKPITRQVFGEHFHV